MGLPLVRGILEYLMDMCSPSKKYAVTCVVGTFNNENLSGKKSLSCRNLDYYMCNILPPIVLELCTSIMIM